MSFDIVAKYNEEINDKLDLIKSFVADQSKEIFELKAKMLKEIGKK